MPDQPPSLILGAATKYLLPLLVLFSVFLLVGGHHLPGGGFVGGLMAAAAVTLCVLAFDLRTARRLLWVRPHHLIATGLLAAGASGVWGPLGGRPFLTASWGELPWPGGGIELGTPLLFDVGVYLTVTGVVVLIVFSLAEE
jgi:multicomponent Na+:H+ antiporter subunit B